MIAVVVFLMHGSRDVDIFVGKVMQHFSISENSYEYPNFRSL